MKLKGPLFKSDLPDARFVKRFPQTPHLSSSLMSLADPTAHSATMSRGGRNDDISKGLRHMRIISTPS